jgi:hypothetical protein
VLFRSSILERRSLLLLHLTRDDHTESDADGVLSEF